MNDDQILEYLRSRAQVEPPPDLVPSVVHAVDAASVRRAWFAPFIPAMAAAGAVAVLVGFALLVGQNLNIGRSPEPALTPSPTEAASPAGSLLQPGDSVELSAVDDEGEWGTILIERGEDLGGYEDAAIEPGTFVVEFFVEYIAHRLPVQPFGSSDWALRPTEPEAEQFIVDPARFERTRGPGFRPETILGQYPAGVDAHTTPTEGRIAFEVPLAASNLALELLYMPLGLEGAVAITVRAPGPPPDPVAFRTPAPLPGDPIYVQHDGLPITVIDSPEADDLFSRPDVCINPEVGYSVTFPDDWYTNTEIGAFSACSWFTPEYFEVVDLSEPPNEIWISTYLIVEGGIGYTSLTQAYFAEELTIDGRPARRVEYNPSPMLEPGYRGYHYVILLGEDWIEGPTFVAVTDTDMADDYKLARAVLDRIMASLDFDP